MSECQNYEYYTCPGWPSYPQQTASHSASSNHHSIHHEAKISLGFIDLFSLKTDRVWSISGSRDSRTDILAIWAVPCEGSTPPCLASCKETDWDYNASLSEDCTIIRDTILYLDMGTNTLLYKHEEESLKFSTSSNEMTGFRGKWGTSVYHKLKINDAKIVGKEEFILVFNGVTRVLNTVDYEREPDWMMGGIGIPTTGNGVVYQDDCSGFEPVQQIIVYGQPASKAIPTDKEILCKGFYDYGTETPGIIPQLVMDDGGYKDYFYPSWCRGMIPDPVWADLAMRRFDFWYYHLPASGTRAISQPAITHDFVPKGNAVIRKRDGQVFHDMMFGFAFRDRNGVAHQVAEINGRNPTEFIADTRVTGYGNEWAFHPIGLL